MGCSCKEGVRRLEEVVAALRAPGGCPWDREQTVESLKPFLIEEAYELLDAIDKKDVALHQEELGDVLLQVALQAQIRKEEGAFDLDAVAHGIADKLVRRHPHVFGDVEVSGTAEVLQNWEAIKRREGKQGDEKPKSPVAGVPAALPALLRAQRVQAKCARSGIPLQTADAAREKIVTACERIFDGGGDAAATINFGELLFALCTVAREGRVDLETALRDTTNKYTEGL